MSSVSIKLIKSRFHFYKKNLAICCVTCARHKLQNGNSLRQFARHRPDKIMSQPTPQQNKSPRHVAQPIETACHLFRDTRLRRTLYTHPEKKHNLCISNAHVRFVFRLCLYCTVLFLVIY